MWVETDLVRQTFHQRVNLLLEPLGRLEFFLLLLHLRLYLALSVIQRLQNARARYKVHEPQSLRNEPRHSRPPCPRYAALFLRILPASPMVTPNQASHHLPRALTLILRNKPLLDAVARPICALSVVS